MCLFCDLLNNSRKNIFFLFFSLTVAPSIVNAALARRSRCMYLSQC